MGAKAWKPAVASAALLLSAPSFSYVWQDPSQPEPRAKERAEAKGRRGSANAVARLFDKGAAPLPTPVKEGMDKLAEEASASGRRVFDGSARHSGGLGFEQVSAGERGRPPGKGDVPAPVPASGLIVSAVPGPVQAVLQPSPEEPGLLDRWGFSLKRWADKEWDMIKDGYYGLKGKVKSLLARLGDDFRSKFMSVWNSGDALSLGKTNKGYLLDAVHLPQTSVMAIRNSAEAFGTKHMVLGLMYVGGQISVEGGPDLKVGDISDSDGGRLGGHKSHQNGLDSDIYFFYKNGRHDPHWNYRVLFYLRDNPFFEPAIIFVSPRVKALLLAECRRRGDSGTAAWANAVLNTNEPNHDDHFHLRIDPAPKLMAGMPETHLTE
jgi:hypothetical protein